MGAFKGTTKDLETIILSLKPFYKGDDYHILNKNCNNFANDLLVKIVGREAPSFVNRMAYLGSYCSCLMPPQQANQAPVDNGGRSAGGGSVYSPVSTNPSYEYRAARNASSSNSAAFSAPGKKLGKILASHYFNVEGKECKLYLGSTNDSGSGSVEMGLQVEVALTFYLLSVSILHTLFIGSA